MVISPGNLFCLPTPRNYVSELVFDESSSHVYVSEIPFRDKMLRMYYCNMCKTTRNKLARELLIGAVVSKDRFSFDFAMQCPDNECYHVQSLRIIQTNLPPPARGTDLTTVLDIPPVVQFGVTFRDHRSFLFASVRPGASISDRTLLELKGENTWNCLGCPQDVNCAHKQAWYKYSEQQPSSATFESDWLFDDYDIPGHNTWKAPVACFSIDAPGQAAVRSRRGFTDSCGDIDTRFAHDGQYFLVCI